MKLTKSQLQVVNRAKQLEAKYGVGNVYIKWINDCWRTCFIIHKAGEEKYQFTLSESSKVNGRVLSSLGDKGLIQPVDINHIPRRDFNERKDGEYIPLGSRIKTELL